MKARTDFYTHFAKVEVAGDPEVSGNGIQLNPGDASASSEVKSVGDDTNIGLKFSPKGTGKIEWNAADGAGYVTGVGGAVTQITSKSTGVTLDKICGAITMHNAALAAAAEVSFTVTNAKVAATDVVAASIQSGATAGAYALTIDAVAAGSFRVSISNQSAGSLSEAIVINFVVIKAVAA